MSRQPRYVGRALPRPDAPAKAAGRAEYICDLSRPRMLWGKIKHSGQAHARIVHIDTSRAERLAGVRAVITAERCPEVRFGFTRDNLALKRGKVRQQRDEVAAVAAIDPDIAAEAVELIEVDYQPLPAVFDPREAMAAGAPLVHETDPKGRPRQSNVLEIGYHHGSGDLDGERHRSKHVVSGSFSTPRIQQSCMGTAGCIAELDPAGNLTMWAKTQIPFLAQRDFTRALEQMGLGGRGCRVVVPALGGGFGSGLDTHAYEYIAILLAQQTGLPVKILFDREEEFACLSPRQESSVHIEQGCTADGRLTYRILEVLLDNGAYTSWGATYPSVMMLPATSLYRVAAVKFDATLVYTNNTYCQAMRGYGNPELSWALESSLDELAAEAGIDALEIRRKNCNEPGESTPMGMRVRSCGLRDCLDGAAESIGWADKRGSGKARRRGVGLASLVHVGGSGRIYRSDASSVILRLDDFGNVYVYSGGVEMGQGLHAALAAGVADLVGVKPEAVHINQTDTATCPWDVGTHASRGAFTALNAVAIAAAELHQRLFPRALEVLPKLVERAQRKRQKTHPDEDAIGIELAELGVGDLDLRDGRLTIAGTPGWLGIELGQLLRALHFRERGEMFTVSALYEPPSDLPDWQRGIGNMSATYAYGTQAAEVEVDTDTGQVRVVKMAAWHDVGKILNRHSLEGQTYGALAQGLGYALYEEVVSEAGRIANPSFRDYEIPTIGEMGFEIELGFVETEDETGPFGAKGVGEPGLVPTAPAIANAIADAVGVRIRDLPITPEKILRALGKI